MLLLGLSGCSSIKALEIFSTPVEKIHLNLKNPNPVESRLVQWFVITPENMESVFKDLEKRKYSLVLFGLTDDGYTNLSLNNAELRKYIIEQQSIIKAYKKYYETKETKETK